MRRDGVIEGDREPAARVEVARALLNKGVTLGRLGRNEEEIRVYDDVVARFGEAVEPGLRGMVAHALQYKAIRLAKLNRDREAIAVCDAILARFGVTGAPGVRRQVMAARFLRRFLRVFIGLRLDRRRTH